MTYIGYYLNRSYCLYKFEFLRPPEMTPNVFIVSFLSNLNQYTSL